LELSAEEKLNITFFMGMMLYTILSTIHSCKCFCTVGMIVGKNILNSSGPNSGLQRVEKI
jgi:hypothetical protein